MDAVSYTSITGLISGMSACANRLEFPERVLYSGSTNFGQVTKWLFRYMKSVVTKSPDRSKDGLAVIYKSTDGAGRLIVSLEDQIDLTVLMGADGVVSDIALRGGCKLKTVLIVKRKML